MLIIISSSIIVPTLMEQLDMTDLLLRDYFPLSKDLLSIICIMTKKSDNSCCTA